jgi:hypothetical protein
VPHQASLEHAPILVFVVNETRLKGRVLQPLFCGRFCSELSVPVSRLSLEPIPWVPSTAILPAKRVPTEPQRPKYPMPFGSVVVGGAEWKQEWTRMRFILWFTLIFLFPVEGYCQWDGLNPPIDPRTNMEGFPTSRLAIQPPSLKDLSSKQMQLWQARQSGNAKTVQRIVPDHAAIMTYTGAIDGKQFIVQIKSGVCKVKNFRLDNFVFRLINPNSGVLTYLATQDAMCNGKSLPRALKVEVGYLNTDGKWKIAFYVEDKQNLPQGRTGLPN